MMKPKLRNEPYTQNILAVRFANGEPLSADQHHFLLSHEKALSHHGYDPILRYYLKAERAKQAEHHSFLMPSDEVNDEAVKLLQKRASIFLQNNKTPQVEFKMKPEQFLKFRALTIGELILYHGNQFLTGAPFYPAGIPYTLYFQWGNLFGVAEYVVIPEQKALEGNVLIHFEMMHERNINQCVHDYQASHKIELKHEIKKPEEKLQVEYVTPQFRPSFRMDIPTLKMT